tara:strand:+ start:2740 stop:4425 length:1686 start_codon:yes stop_codon:yes gene_type:complete
MVIKKKKFEIEDTEFKFEYQKSNSNLNINFNRVSFIFFVFFLISLIFSIHLMHLGSRNDGSVENIKSVSFSKKLFRADIIDRDGKFVVKTVNSINVGINPSQVIDKRKLLINLRFIFPEKNFIEIEKKLDRGKFFWLEKKISNEKYEKIMRLGDKSLIPSESLIRLYPHRNLFSHIIGQIDEDNNGISGLEKSLDEKLKKTKDPIKLSVDSDIQYLVREELNKFNQIFKVLGSAAILMNVNNGEIISLVSLPDFDPNQRKKITDKIFINRVAKGVYEFGSVFKTFTLAAAFDDKLIEPETKFEDLPKNLTCAGFPIREYDNKIPSTLTAEQILIRSGNIGSVKIGQIVGEDKFKSFLSKVDILKKTNFDIEEIGTPIKFNWGKCPLATASFGHGITTTLLQLAKAYSIIANGGYNIQPTLIKEKKKFKKEKILNQEVSKKILPILRKIVTTKEGTASLANVSGYEIGGKTGTAQKSVNGVYTKKKINSFISVFPTSKPKFVLAIMLDEPKTNEDYIYHYRDGSNIKYKGTPYNTAGWTTVEVTGQIIEKIGPILATKYSEK